MYKIGKTSSGEKELKSRYTTYFVRPIILYFREVRGDYNIHEANLKSILQPYRVPHSSGNPSEFVRMKLDSLINEVDKYFDYADVDEESDEELEEETELESESNEVITEETVYESRVVTKKLKIISSVNVKTCCECGKELSIATFNKNKKGKYGVDSRCKPCRKEYDANRYRNSKAQKTVIPVHEINLTSSSN
jgi:hypothetical protein